MRLKEEQHKRMAPWAKWSAIGTVCVCVATVIMAMPTAGQYASHVAAIWHCPEQQETIQNVVSNQISLQIQVENVAQDVRDIKQALYHPRAYIASAKTNSPD